MRCTRLDVARTTTMASDQAADVTATITVRAPSYMVDALCDLARQGRDGTRAMRELLSQPHRALREDEWERVLTEAAESGDAVALERVVRMYPGDFRAKCGTLSDRAAALFGPSSAVCRYIARAFPPGTNGLPTATPTQLAERQTMQEIEPAPTTTSSQPEEPEQAET